MLPTVDVWGESMVVSRFHRNGIDVQVGDLVMYKIPTSSENGVKRVLGLPGDYVLMNTPESGNDAMIQVIPTFMTEGTRVRVLTSVRYQRVTAG